MRNNTFCTTLSQEKTSFFTNSGVSIGTTGVANHWNLNPYDPMSDYACRILAQRY